VEELMRGRWVLVLLLLLARLGGPAWAQQTYPRDATGAVAPPCNFLGSDQQTFTLCGPQNPLPVSPPTTTNTTDPTGWGKTAFLAALPGGAVFGGVPIFEDDLSITMLRGDGTNVNVFRSTDGGVTFGALQNSTSVPSAFAAGVTRAALKTGGFYLLGPGSITQPSSPLWRAPAPVGVWTASTVSGLTGGATYNITNLEVQASTVLATARDSTAAANTSFVCRSTNTGSTYTCTQPAAITGNLESGSLASPAASIWLLVDDSTPMKVYRSTDDGVTWTQVTTLVRSSGAVNENIVCLSSTLCVAFAGSIVYRSTDAGVTWGTAVATLSSSAGNVCNGGVANFGQNVLLAISNCGVGGITTVSFSRSGDGGLTWTRLPDQTMSTATAVATFLGRFATRSGRAVSTSVLGSATQTQYVYSPIVTGPIAQDAQGHRQVLTSFGEIIAQLTTFGANIGVPTNPLPNLNMQGATILNAAPVVSAANTAASVPLTGAVGTRVCIHFIAVKATGAAATFTLTVSDGATTVLDLGTQSAALAGAADTFSGTPLLCGQTGNTVTVNIGAGGVGAVTTTSVIASRQ